MFIPQSIKEQACIGLLHFRPKKELARELNVSVGTIRDWSIYVDNQFFDWITEPHQQLRKAQLHKAVEFWFDAYPIGYSDVARRLGVRPSTLYNHILRRIAKLPDNLKPKRLRFWAPQRTPSIGTFTMKFEKLSDIPADRPLTLAERKALLREMQDTRDRLICAESLLEVAVESCKDELKKKELMRQLEQTRKALASFGSVV